MQRKKLPIILNLAIITMITSMVWVGFEIYRSISKEPGVAVPPEIAAELSPNLDLEILSAISERVYLEDNEIDSPLPAVSLIESESEIQEQNEEDLEQEGNEESQDEPETLTLEGEQDSEPQEQQDEN